MSGFTGNHGPISRFGAPPLWQVISISMNCGGAEMSSIQHEGKSGNLFIILFHSLSPTCPRIRSRT